MEMWISGIMLMYDDAGNVQQNQFIDAAGNGGPPTAIELWFYFCVGTSNLRTPCAGFLGVFIGPTGPKGLGPLAQGFD